jgi:flagellar hook protein FlgE
MGSFSIALTGLKAETESLNTIGNNLANLNTTGYKDQTTSFASLFYEQTGSNGSGDALQQGLGVKVSGTASNFNQGSLAATGNSTDMAVNGNGFFVANNNGVQELTRAGNFQLSSTGELETTDGYAVQGYSAINGSSNANGPLGDLTLPVGSSEAAKATTTFSMTANLSSSAPVGAQFSSGITVYDSLGTSQVATATFTKMGTNQWSYSVALPAGASTGTPVNNTGTLTFDSSGNLTSPTGSVSGIKFPGMADGAADLTMNWNLTNAAGNGNISQTSGASAASATTQDGFASGTYQSFTVDSAGNIAAQFSNGQSETIGQVALASVTNVEGLTMQGGNNYVTNAASGPATIGEASTGGRGTIENDTLEASNVDISTEFSNLIVSQRGFEANSKTITTFDTLTQETINLIH